MLRIHRLGRFLLYLTLSFAATDAYAQWKSPSVTVGVGLMRNVRADVPGPVSHAFYPEIQVATPLFRDPQLPFLIEGSLYAGAWRERDSHTSFCPPCETYELTGVIIGARLGAVLTRLGVPVAWFVGASRQFLRADGGSGEFSQGPVQPFHSENVTAMEFGLRAQKPIGEHIVIGVGAQTYWNISDLGGDPNSRRTAFGVTIGYK